MSGNRRANRGSITAGVLICLAVASAIFVSILSGAAAQRREIGRWQRTMQARWLAESALERAAGRLANNPDYDGETWTVAAENLGGRQGAVVRIRMDRGNANFDQILLLVEAQYPDSGRRAVRFTKQVRLRKSVSIPPATGGDSNAD